MADARLGVDVGGTFTDFVVFDAESGSFSVGKTLTTPQDLSLGIIRGTREAAERAGLEVRDISQVTYGTTLVANLLLERKGVRVGLIATEGFRDILETGTEQRYDMYDLTAKRAEPLVPRNLRRTVRERVGWDGRGAGPAGTIVARPDLIDVRGVRGGDDSRSAASLLPEPLSRADGPRIPEGPVPPIRRVALIGGRPGGAGVPSDIDDGRQRLRGAASAGAPCGDG